MYATNLEMVSSFGKSEKLNAKMTAYAQINEHDLSVLHSLTTINIKIYIRRNLSEQGIIRRNCISCMDIAQH